MIKKPKKKKVYGSDDKSMHKVEKKLISAYKTQ
jgi:hypothetical protein